MAGPQMFFDYATGPVLTQLAAAQVIKAGIPRISPAEFFSMTPSTVVGAQLGFDLFVGERASAKIVNFNAAAKGISMTQASKAYAVAMGTRESFDIDTDTVYLLKSDQPFVRERATKKIMDDIVNYSERIKNLQTYLVASILANKLNVYYDQYGEIQTTSSGAYVTAQCCPFAVPTANSLTKTGTILGSQTVGDWSQPSTDIPASLRAQKVRSIEDSGYESGTILYGQNIPSYFANNSEMMAYMARQPQLNQKFMDTNEVPDGLLDYKWIPMYKQIFASRSQTTQAQTTSQWFANNQIVILPPMSQLSMFYDFWEAGALIPTMGPERLTEGWEEAMGMMQMVHGQFAYCLPFCWNPPSCSIVQGWYGLPTFKTSLIFYNWTVS